MEATEMSKEEEEGDGRAVEVSWTNGGSTSYATPMMAFEDLRRCMPDCYITADGVTVTSGDELGKALGTGIDAEVWPDLMEQAKGKAGVARISRGA